MTLTGAPARLRPLPRLLLRTEVPVSGSAAGAALLACWQQRPGVARVAPAAAAATFAVHAVREAIYLSPVKAARSWPPNRVRRHGTAGRPRWDR